jgi:stage IV sporulation protein FB
VKDEITIALWGPLCNLFTAGFFVALWWFSPTMYAFTDTACYSSLSIALVNLLPAYPLDGGRILRCLLVRAFAKSAKKQADAERKAKRVCCAVTLCFAVALLTAFFVVWAKGTLNFSLFTFGLFLLFGVFDGKREKAVYERMDFSCAPLLKRGAELKRVAVLDSCPVKDTFRFLSRGYFLVLDVYDSNENRLYEVSQNRLSQFFAQAKTPYEPIGEICARLQKNTNTP